MINVQLCFCWRVLEVAEMVEGEGVPWSFHFRAFSGIPGASVRDSRSVTAGPETGPSRCESRKRSNLAFAEGA